MQYKDLQWFNTINYTPPKNFKDLTGYENENFKIIGRAPNQSGHTMWNCLCKHCGNYCIKLTTNVKKHTSCGCIRYSTVKEKLTKNLTGNRYGKLIALYKIGNNKSRNAIWRCQCDCGQECDVDSNNLISLHTTSCGCNKQEKSIGAKNIIKILQENNIPYKAEQSFKDLCGENNHPYYYDFAIYCNNKVIRLIEFDGIQHFQNTWGKWENNSLTEQQKRDQKKNQYAKDHNIPLVRIPYWERDNINLEMIMGDQFLVKD